MPIDRERGLGFVHIPKTAGTAIEMALGLHGDWRLEDRGRCYGRIRGEDLLRRGYATNYLQHLSIQELWALLKEEGVQGCEHWWWFTVVRHPWTRLLSAFRRKDPDLCQLYAYRSERDLRELDLAAFLEVAAWLDHPHLRPQWRFLAGSAPCVQWFRYENLQDLLGSLSVRIQQPLHLERVNLPTLDFDESTLANRGELMARAAEVYGEDFQRFGYRLPTG